MRLKSILRGIILASGTAVLVAGALALSSGKKRRRANSEIPTCQGAQGTVPVRPGGREYFRITRSRSKSARPQWVLEGFGRYQCFLFFDSWQQAMDQANFQLESLGAEEPKLIQVTTSGMRSERVPT